MIPNLLKGVVGVFKLSDDEAALLKDLISRSNTAWEKNNTPSGDFIAQEEVSEQVRKAFLRYFGHTSEHIE